MKILLCAATSFEVASTLKYLNAREEKTIEPLITGIGLLASTYTLTKAVCTNHPDLMIQAGIAGTLDKQQKLGNVVAVKSETVGDLGVQEEGFRSVFDLGFLGPDDRPWQDKKLINESRILTGCGLPLVDGITVNEITTDKERTEHYRTVHKAQAESMEGAALHYVGLMEGIPFLQIRSLSNFVGERDKTKWAMQEAVANLNRELQRILKNLTA